MGGAVRAFARPGAGTFARLFGDDPGGEKWVWRVSARLFSLPRGLLHY